MNRRNFVKSIGIAMAGMFSPSVTGMARAQRPLTLPPGSEEYGPFVILPAGTPLPAEIAPLKNGVPNLCGTGDEGPGITAAISQKPTFDAFVADSPLRVLALTPLPSNLTSGGGYILRHRGGPTYCAIHSYLSFDPKTREAVESIRILAIADFYHPHPIWVPDGEAATKEVTWTKTSFNGAPAVLVSSAVEVTLHWVLGDQLNVVIINRAAASDGVEKYLELLAEIN